MICRHITNILSVLLCPPTFKCLATLLGKSFNFRKLKSFELHEFHHFHVVHVQTSLILKYGNYDLQFSFFLNLYIIFNTFLHLFINQTIVISLFIYKYQDLFERIFKTFNNSFNFIFHI